MRRNFKITLAYDGAEFYGWQVQPGLPTVQGTLAECIRHLTGELVLPQGSGRTDAGVHALAQVASVQLETPIPESNLETALNDLLPPSIRVNAVQEVEDSFHARHSAKAKTYRYRIYRGDICPPFLARYVFHDPYPLNENAVMRSSEEVVGTHDFTSFAASDPERSERLANAWPGQLGDADSALRGRLNVRTIHSSQWTRTKDELTYTVRGSGFLHHMVRNLVGTFLLVGKGALQVEDVGPILEARDRSAAGPTAPACGLYLVSVEYTTPSPTPVARRGTWI